MLEETKNKIKLLKGKKIKVLVDIGRNKSDVYNGVVLETYSNVWTLKTETDIKSFSYSDVFINNVIISS